MKLLKRGFFNVEKINKSNTFSMNQKFHVELFDPETKSRTKANIKCKQMLYMKINKEELDEVTENGDFENNIFAFACNQFYIKTFGWQDGVILSQILYWVFTNKRETVFFSDLELSKRLYMDIKTIIKSKIWSQSFVSKEKAGKKFKIKIDLKSLISFIREMKK